MAAISKHRSAIMGIAALWIYYFHIVPLDLFGQRTFSFWEVFLKNQGYCGVDIFLFVSGFGLAVSFVKMPLNSPADYLRYAKRRLFRIYAVTIPIALMIAVVDDWSISAFFLRITGIRQLFGYLYDYLWFIPCILICYLIAPFCFKLLLKAKKKALLTAAVCILWITLLWAGKSFIRNDLYGLLTRFPVFFLGLCFGQLYQSGFEFRPLHDLLTLAVFFLGVALQVCLSRSLLPWFIPALNAQINLFIAPPLIILLSRLMEMLSVRKLGFLRPIYRILIFFGSISFEFYSLQEWVFQKFQNSGTLLRLFSSSLLLQQAACFLVTLFGAAALHGLILWLSSRLKACRRAGS